MNLKPLITLLAIVNPLAIVPFFIHYTQGFSDLQRKRTIRTAAISAFLVIAACALFGLQILEIFNISLPSFQVGGGMLLLISAMNMLNAQPAETKPATNEMEEGAEKTDSANSAPKRVAILATDGFEQVELSGPRDALQAAGHTTHILSTKAGQVHGFHHDKHGDQFDVYGTLAEAKASDYDAVLLPGGVMNGDAIRMDKDAQAFVKAANDAGQPIAVICHGGWLLIDAGVAKGRSMTSWPSLSTDIRNAGGTWVDEEVHTDKNLISSRKPDDIPAFNKALLAALGQSVKS